MEEAVTVKNAYRTGENSTHRRVSRTGIDRTIPYPSSIITIDMASCTSPTPPSVYILKGGIGNICQTTTLNFSKSSELNAPIDRILTNDYIYPSVRSQIVNDELFDSSSRDI